MFFCIVLFSFKSFASELSALGLHVVPYPQQVYLGGEGFTFSGELTITLDPNHSSADKFAADELIRCLRNEWNVKARISEKKGDKTIVLTRRQAPRDIKPQAYQIETANNDLIIKAKDETGLFG